MIKNRVLIIWLAMLISSASVLPLFSNTENYTASERQLRERTNEEIGRDPIGGWSYEILDPGPAAGFDVDLAMGPNGEDIHISYHNDNEDELMYAKWGGNYWNVAPISDMLVKNYGTAVAANSQGKGYIAFADSGVLKILSNVQGNWEADIVEGGQGIYAGCYPSMKFDSQNRLHISYQDATQGVFDLKYAYKSGNDWNIVTVDSQDTTGKFTSLALDSNNRPHICYQKTEGTTLKYAYKDGGGTWDTETVDDGVEWVHGLHTSIALDSSNRPHIVYHSVKNGVDKYLSYARWTGTQWVKENPDPDRNMGEYPSIVVDDNDRPHISYHDIANDNLKYAYYNGAEWELSTLDDQGNVGTNTAIGLDGDGRPVIAYTDSASNSLKLIRWDEEAPVANAGSDITIGQKETADFDGSASTDNFCVSRYEWTFMEGSYSRTLTGVDPAHKFISAGSYFITLNVTDAAGNWHTDTMTVTVNDTTKPTAKAGMDYYGNQGIPIQFNGNASTDNVGIASYKWKVVDETGVHDLTGAKPSHTFAEAGLFEVILNVSDAAGNWARDNASVIVRDGTPPVAVAGDDQVIDQGDSITLNGIDSTDNFGIEKYVWTFEDNGFQKITDRKMTYKFQNAGKFIITLNVSDAEGNWGIDTVTITVLDTLSPTADAGVDLQTPQGQVVIFNASGSTDNLEIVKYEWVFVYGNQTILLDGEVANYIFDVIGIYDIRLIVKDARGNKDETTISVNVTDGIPPIPLISTNTTGYLGEKVILNASGSVDNTGIVQYVWKFEYIGDTKVLYGKRVAYNFLSLRDYNISLNITDREGNWANDYFILSIIKEDADDDDTGGDDDDDDTPGGGGGGVGRDDKGALDLLYRNCLWLSLIIIVILVVGGAIIVALVVAKKKKAEELEREKKEKEEEQERELTPDEYYDRLYGGGSSGASGAQPTKAPRKLPPGITFTPPPAGPSGPPPAGMPRAPPSAPVSPGPKRPGTGPTGPPPGGMPRVPPSSPVSPGPKRPGTGPTGPPQAGMPRVPPSASVSPGRKRPSAGPPGPAPKALPGAKTLPKNP